VVKDCYACKTGCYVGVSDEEMEQLLAESVIMTTADLPPMMQPKK